MIEKEDSKTILISDYEQEISALQSEAAFLKTKQSLADDHLKIETSSVLKEENELLHSEIKSYKSIKANLEE